MTIKQRLRLSAAAFGVLGFVAATPLEVSAQTAVAIDNDDIGGVVTGPNGPEAGVWVIAETHDLPTRYAKMVVTDDQGRYVVPDLPKAKYKVWVRGYGLVDSPKVDGEPGQAVSICTAVAAPNEAAAAKYYPAIYWYSMLKIPAAEPVRRQDGDIPDKVKQTDWLNLMKNNGCVGCHQLGQLSTRTFPKDFGEFTIDRGGVDAAHRSPARPAQLMIEHPGRPARRRADQVFRRLDRSGRQRRTAARQAAAAAGRRAQYRRHHLGLGRREAISARPDRLGPALSDRQCLWTAVRLARIFAPTSSRSSTRRRTPSPPSRRRCATRTRRRRSDPAMRRRTSRWPVALLGQGEVWDTKVNNHNAMIDQNGRVWFAAAVRGAEQPGLLQEGLGPSVGQGRSRWISSTAQLTMLDPKTMKYTFVDTCFGTHHLQFGYDANETLWTRAAAGRWSAGSTPRCSTRPATPRSRRAGRR